MAVRPKHNPPVNMQTGQVSCRLAGLAILRPLAGGGYLGFESVEDARDHPTTLTIKSGQVAA